MTARPSTVPLLDTNQTNRTVPASGKVTDGYVLNDLLPASNANYLWGWAGDWLTWLDERTANGATPAFDFALQAIDAVGASGLAGGILSLVSGEGDGVGAGGALDITAGDGGTSGAGGALSLTSGTGGGAAAGGAFSIVAGDGGSSGIGGALSFTAGDGNAAAAGGAISIICGAGGSTSGVGGALSLTAGAGGGSGDGGTLTLAAGSAAGLTGGGGTCFLSAGSGGTLTGAGGALTVSAGDSGGAGGGGGDLTLKAGSDLGGAGTGGDVVIQTGDGVASKGLMDFKIGTSARMELQTAGVNIAGGLVVGIVASSQTPQNDAVIIGTSAFKAYWSSPNATIQFSTNDYLAYNTSTNKWIWVIDSTEEAALDATNGFQVGDANFAMRWDGTNGSLFFDSGDYLQFDRSTNRFNFVIASSTEFYYNPTAGSGLNVDNPVRGTAAGGNAGLIGTSTGSESALFADSSGGTGYGIVAQADTTSPARAALRLVAQNANPTSPQLGDIYVNTGGSLRFYDGSTWRTVTVT